MGGVRMRGSRGAGRRGFALALGFVVCALTLAALAAPRPSGATADDRADEYTPVVQSVMSKPRWFRDSLGDIRLVYELRLVNGFPVPVTVAGVNVRSPERRHPIARLAGEELEAAMTLMSTPGTPTVEIPPSGTAVVWMDVAMPNRRAIPAAVRHRLTVQVPPGFPVPDEITTTGAYSRVDRRAPTVLGPPLRGPGWVAVGSCCDGPHRRSIQPVNGGLFLGQRFAIDWNGVDANDRFVVGDPSLNQSWVFYDKPVLAVAKARVVEAVDRWPDQVPNDPRPVTLEEADGNYVILRLGKGRFAFYAHLKPGSVRVEPGDRVRRGQVIGRLGNSGSSTGPHLHFQLMDRPSALASDGLPYVFSRFSLQGRIPPLTEELAQQVNEGQPIPIDPSPPGTHHKQLPRGQDVVDFPR